MSELFRACDYSKQVGEQLEGTAPRAENWLLLEYPRPWSAQAYADSEIPVDVKAYIAAEMAKMPYASLQLITQENRQELRDLALYIIHAGWVTQRIRRFVLPTYADLLDLPLAAIAAGEEAFEMVGGQVITEPVYIVCTNGKRDICCAKHGLQLFRCTKH